MKKIFVALAVALCMVMPAFCAQNHVSDAGAVAYLNPGAKILSGQIVDLTYRYGIAASDISSNETETVFTDGIWRLARADTNAIVLGANVYQSSATNVTGTSTGNRYIGVCVQAVTVCTAVYDSVGMPSKWVNVDIGAPQRQIVIGVDTQPHSSYLDTLALGLASNKYWVGSVLGAPAAFPFSGLFTTTVGGVAAATTTGLALTNATASGTLTPLVLTNVTVNGGVLSGVGVIVTNATVSGAALSGVSLVVTNATVGGAVLSGVGVVVTNVIVASSPFIYLDGGSNIVTNTFVTSVTFGSGTPVVSSPTISLSTGTPVVSAPSISLQTGTPAVSTVALSLETVAAGAVAVTVTKETATFVKP